MDRRKELFKKSIDGDSCRRQREDTMVTIRKQKRENNLSKRRLIDNTAGNTCLSQGAVGPTTAQSSTTQGPLPSNGPSIEELPLYFAQCHSGVLEQEMKATRAIRRLLSVEKAPPVLDVIQAKLLPRLVEFLQRHDSPGLQFESAWALTNVASTQYTEVVVSNGAVPYLVRNLDSPNADVREQSIWCLGNICGESVEFRDLVLSHNAMELLLKNIRAPASTSLYETAVWVLSNFLRGKPMPKLDLLRPAVAILSKIICATNDNVVALADAAWALSYASDGADDRIKMVIDAGCCPPLIGLLAHSNSLVVTPALRCLGNLVSSTDDSLCQSVLDSGILSYIPALLKNPKKNIRKEACWLLSNVAAGNRSQICSLISTKGIIPAVISQLCSAEWDVQKEACYVVTNICCSGGTATRDYVHYLVELGVIKALCGILDSADVKVVTMALNCLEIILKCGQMRGDDAYAIMLQEAQGFEKLEQLQEHANDFIYQKAVSMIEVYLGVDEEENSAPPNNLLQEVATSEEKTTKFCFQNIEAGSQTGAGFTL